MEQRASLKSFLEIKVWSVLAGAEPRLTIFQVAVIADLAAWRQVTAPLPCSSKSEYYLRPTLSHFRLYNPSSVAISGSQTPDCLVHRRTGYSV